MGELATMILWSGATFRMKLQNLALIGGMAIAAITWTADAAVYKWVDKDGKVKYGDRPPPAEAVQSQEINRSGVPLALQDRLRSLDKAFNITRITGNVEVAYVCLEYSTERGYDPPFVDALESSRLGTIKQSAKNLNSYPDYNDQYDDQDEYSGNAYSQRNRKVADDKCPARPVSGENMQRRLYVITFDPKAVGIYREAPK